MTRTADATTAIRAYYDALRAGDPLEPFFATEAAVADEPTRAAGDAPSEPAAVELVKFGISERLVGADAIRAGLRSQTETTTDWHVESHDLRVTERDGYAWFADDVTMAWTHTERGIRYEFRTRWSGTLERLDGEWRFVGMHVSTADDL